MAKFGFRYVFKISDRSEDMMASLNSQKNYLNEILQTPIYNFVFNLPFFKAVPIHRIEFIVHQIFTRNVIKTV